MLTREYAHKLEIMEICRDGDAPEAGRVYDGVYFAFENDHGYEKSKVYCFGYTSTGSCLVGGRDMSFFVFLRDGFAVKNGTVYAISEGAAISFGKRMRIEDLEAEAEKCRDYHGFASALGNSAKRKTILAILEVIGE